MELLVVITIIGILIALLLPAVQAAGDTSRPIRVLNPDKLEATLPAERIAIGQGYKPSMALLPGGELAMVALFQDKLLGGKLREWTGLWRSNDGGRNWSERIEVQDMIGREQWLTCTKDGTLFATCHLLANDVNNKDGYCHSYIHRSTDGGRTWQRTRIGPEGFPANGSTYTSRNVVELPDGRLLLGVAGGSYADRVSCFWISRDNGTTWEPGPQVVIGQYRNQRFDNNDKSGGFFNEDFNFRNESGKLLHFVRFGQSSSMYPMNDGRPVPSGSDQVARTLRCESTDDGETWVNVKDCGDYGQHYTRVICLNDGRLLMTFTQRAVTEPFGLRALVSYDDGDTWDFDSDHLILDENTPSGWASGGGFGNTIQLADSSLISCYSYHDAVHGSGNYQVEVVRWSLPAPVPEPATVVLLGVGALCLGLFGRWKQSQGDALGWENAEPSTR